MAKFNLLRPKLLHSMHFFNLKEVKSLSTLFFPNCEHDVFNFTAVQSFCHSQLPLTVYREDPNADRQNENLILDRKQAVYCGWLEGTEQKAKPMQH